MSCQPLKFGVGNQVEDMTLTSNVPCVTDIDWLKNEWPARQAKFSDLTSDPIIIEGVLDEPTLAHFVAIPGHNLPIDAQIKIELLETDTSAVDLLQMGYENVTDMIPLGVWAAGVDPYGGKDKNQIGGNSFIKWFGRAISYQRIKISISHGYTPDLSPPPSGRFLQDANGLCSMEAESGEVELRGIGTWVEDPDNNASNNIRMDKEGSKFYTDPTKGPRLKFKYTASKNGIHDVWVRCKPETQTNSIYCIHEGHHVTKIIKPLSSNYQWIKPRTITLVAGQNYELIFAARDYNFKLDKVEIKTAGSAAPTGEGDAESGEGIAGSNDNVSLRMLVVGRELVMDNNFSYNGVFTYMTPPELKQTFDGLFIEGADEKPVRTCTLPLEMMSDGDRIRMIYFRRALKGRPFIVSPFNGRTEWEVSAHTMLGRFANQLKFSHSHEGIHEDQLVIVEA